MTLKPNNLNSVLLTIKKIVSTVKKLLTTVAKKIIRLIDRAPLVTFFGLLVILLVLILVGNFLRKPKTAETTSETAPKHVEISSIGENPRVQVSAKVEKTGVIKLVAQSNGIVQAIHRTEGSRIGRGQWIISLSNTYQGGTIASVSRQVAQKNNEFTELNYPVQMEMIKKRREIANLSDGQADKLRDIANQSIDETKSLISLNEEILTSLNAQIEFLETSGADETDIMTAKQGKAGLLTGLNALKTALRNTEYQADEDHEPGQLANKSRELTQQQLDIEERSLNLNMEISKLNLRLAQINESFMYPASPVNGVVERIYVKIGDSVNPGTVLATISSDKTSVTAVAAVSAELAENISTVEKSKVTIGTIHFDLAPRYISSEPTEGNMHAVLFTIPDEYVDQLSNSSYITIEIPVSKPKSAAAVPFVPLDAIFQTQTDAYVFVASPSASGALIAQSRAVNLGDVIGSYVRIEKGLQAGDQVIINRNIIAGDPVTIQ